MFSRNLYIQPQMGIIYLRQKGCKYLDIFFCKADVFDIYGNGYKIEELRNGIIRVDYPQVDWERVLRQS